jgi:hypothetical protein
MKRLLMATIAIFVFAFLFDYVLHGVLLKNDYALVKSLYRPDEEIKLGIMALGYLVWAFGVAWLYSKGVESKDWMGQGLRFGLALACVWLVPSYLGNYATQPLPGMLIVKALAGDTVNALACGLVAAAVYRGGASQSQAGGA